MVYGGSSPNGLDKNTQSAMFLHVAVVPAEQHYKSGACVLRVCGAGLFGAYGDDVGGRAYEAGAPYVLRQR